MSKSDDARTAVRSPADRAVDPADRTETADRAAGPADCATGPTDRGPSIDSATLLSHLSDDYTRRVLGALDADPLTAPEIVERLDMSRSTVYRRLDDLESAGIVATTPCLDQDGQHRRRFHLAFERARVRFGADGVSVELTD